MGRKSWLSILGTILGSASAAVVYAVTGAEVVAATVGATVAGLFGASIYCHHATDREAIRAGVSRGPRPPR